MRALALLFVAVVSCFGGHAGAGAFYGARRAAQLSTAVDLYRPIPFNRHNGIVYAGDSIINFGSGTLAGGAQPSGIYTFTGRAAWTWGNWLIGAPAANSTAVNAGIYGNTTTQVLARYENDVLAKHPLAVVLEPATNDYNVAGYPSSVTDANLDMMITYNRQHRIRTFLQLIAPRGSTGAEMQPDVLANWNAINALQLAKAASDVTIINTEPNVGVGPTFVCPSGRMCRAYGPLETVDNLHPSWKGGFDEGTAYAGVLSQAWGAGYPLSTSNTDPSNAVTNGWLTGNQGTISGSGSGQVATGWTITVPTGPNVVASLVPFPDGSQEQQFVVSGTWSNSTQGAITFTQPVNFGMMFSAGDRIEAVAVLDVDPGLLNIGPAIELEASMAGADIKANAIGEPTNATARLQHDGPFKVIVRSPVTKLPQNPGTGTVGFNINLNNTSSTENVAGTIRVAKIMVHRLPSADRLPKAHITSGSTSITSGSLTVTTSAN